MGLMVKFLSLTAASSTQSFEAQAKWFVQGRAPAHPTDVDPKGPLLLPASSLAPALGRQKEAFVSNEYPRFGLRAACAHRQGAHLQLPL